MAVNKSNIGKTLYHYTTAQGFCGIIDSESLHCSNSLFLNDPTETEYFESILEEVLKDPICKKTYDDLHIGVIGKMLKFDRCYLLSLSQEPDKLNMWRYYSTHNGVCIGFDTKELKHQADLFGLEFMKVIYNKKKQLRLLSDFFYKIKDFMLGDAPDMELVRKIVSECLDIYSKYRITFKNACFQDEKEIRLVMVKSNNSIIYEKEIIYEENEYMNKESQDEIPNEELYEIIGIRDRIKFRVNHNGTLIEYFDFPLNNKPIINKPIITSIMIHPSAALTQISTTEKMLEFKGLHIDVSQSKKPFREL